MADSPRVLTEKAARQLSNTTKTPPLWRGATPRWLTQMIPWTPVFRVRRTHLVALSQQRHHQTGTPRVASTPSRD